MATFIIDIKEGKTKCKDCPFVRFDDYGVSSCCIPHTFDIDCEKYDIGTMQIVGTMQIAEK